MAAPIASSTALRPGTAAARRAPSRVETFVMAMPELHGRERTIRVYLPKGYDAETAAYPVLYLQDGQNLFTAGAYGDWLVDETLDRLRDSGELRGLIVVGVDNGPARWDEYSPWPNGEMHAWVAEAWSPARRAGGDGAAYVAFLVNTLKPTIDRRYRTLGDREHTGIGGSSMGGLIALYAGLTRADVFSRVMAMSTAVWFAEGGGTWLSRNRLVEMIRATPAPRGVRFYVDVGTNERSRDADPDVRDAHAHPVSYPQAYVEGSTRIVDALRAAGVRESNLCFVVDSGAPHHESAWARRFPSAVRWLYAE